MKSITIVRTNRPSLKGSGTLPRPYARGLDLRGLGGSLDDLIRSWDSPSTTTTMSTTGSPTSARQGETTEEFLNRLGLDAEAGISTKPPKVVNPAILAMEDGADATPFTPVNVEGSGMLASRTAATTATTPTSGSTGSSNVTQYAIAGVAAVVLLGGLWMVSR